MSTSARAARRRCSPPALPAATAPSPAAFEGDSADGTRVFFSTSEALTAGDTDTRRDIYRRTGATTELVSTGPAGGNGAFDADFMGASLDGSNAYVRTEESLVATDTDTGCAAGQGPQCRDVYEYAGGTTSLVSHRPGRGQRGIRCQRSRPCRWTGSGCSSTRASR